MGKSRRNPRINLNKNRILEFFTTRNLIIAIVIIVLICIAILGYKLYESNLRLEEIEKEKQQLMNKIFEDKTEDIETENTINQNLANVENTVNTDIIKPDTRIKISSVGDIICEDEIYKDAYNSATGEYDFSHIFANIKEHTEDADLTLGLLETNFVTGENISGFSKLNTPIQFAKELKNIGIDLLHTASNHSLDYGIAGVQQTLANLKDIGFDTVGTYASEEASKQILIKDVKGIKLAFLSYTYDTNNSVLKDAPYCVNIINKEKIKNDIFSAKEQGAEYVFIHMHWGDVIGTEANAEQKDLANYLFDNGADFIIGSHPASLQKMEVRQTLANRNIFIAYSAGNFISSRVYANSNIGAILNIEIVKSGKTGVAKLSKVTYTPIYLMDNGRNAANRFELLDMGKVITNYENGNEGNISKSTYTKVKEARQRVDKLIGL